MGIEDVAFADCDDLQEIILPDSLYIIGNEAFSYCTRLVKLALPDNLKEIGYFAFDGCGGLVELEIPASVEYLASYIVQLTSSLRNIVFLGDAPEILGEPFWATDAKVYYPAGNATYADAIQMSSGNVRWIEACASHQFVSKTQGATCVLTGYTGQECSVCGLVEVTGELIPPTGHDLVLDYVQEPSCEDWGFTAYHCTACGEGIAEDEVAPLGHNYDENGNCAWCITNEAQTPTYEQDAQNSTGGLDAMGAVLIWLIAFVAFAVIIVLIVLLCKLLHKIRKR